MYKRQEQKTASGLYIASNAQEKPQRGTIVAVGAGKVNDKGERIPMDLSLIHIFNLHALPVSGYRLHALCHRRHRHPQRLPLVLTWCIGGLQFIFLAASR